MNSQDSPQLGLGGSHHLPLYNIFCASPRDQHLNVTLSSDSQMGIPKFPHLGFLRLWGLITLCEDLRWRWSLKQSCSPCRELFNGMSQATCIWGNWGKFWLLMVGSQIGNLTLGLSFGHNLCLKCPNGSCEPILDMYIPRAFQGILQSNGFWPLQSQSKDMGVHWDSNS
jgi:hypothetical protein